MGGLVDALFGSDDAPITPERIVQNTGQVVEEKAGTTLDEEADTKKNARAVARKGTSQFRIPLEAASTGAKVSSNASGLKI